MRQGRVAVQLAERGGGGTSGAPSLLRPLGSTQLPSFHIGDLFERVSRSVIRPSLFRSSSVSRFCVGRTSYGFWCSSSAGISTVIFRGPLVPRMFRS